MWAERTDMGTTEVWQPRLGRDDKFRVPEPEDDSGSKDRFPVRLSGDGLVDEPEQSVRVILHLDVHLSAQQRSIPCQVPFPCILNNFVFLTHVEFRVLVLRLIDEEGPRVMCQFTVSRFGNRGPMFRKQRRLTFISRLTVSANVGIAWLGCFMVRAAWIPFSPCQTDSLMIALVPVVRSREGSWNMTLQRTNRLNPVGMKGGIE